MPRK
ncbi:putative lipoprotein, partial [Vibrio cholerae HC-50A1]|jgi:hypothetical protein